ncbi:hypothetical protein ACVINI_005182 [Rhizobium beringeri]
MLAGSFLIGFCYVISGQPDRVRYGRDIEQLLHLSARTETLIAVYDGDDRLRYANSAFRSVYFIESDETPLWPDLMRRNFQLRRGTVIQTSNFDEWLRSTQSRRGKIGYRAFETDLCDGRWFWMTEAVLKNGWMLCIASDITSLRAHGRTVRQDRDQAIKASYTDELTSVANRRFVMARVDDMLAAAQHGNNGCLAVFDIDNFKHINDRLGHQAGDASCAILLIAFIRMFAATIVLGGSAEKSSFS